jgi:translation elongation factor EF-Tu-like GTPase
MNDKPRDAEVLVTFLPTEHGGRSQGVISGYRPQFYYSNHDWDAEYAFLDGAAALGEATRAFLTFLSPHEHVDKLTTGTPFLVREGQKVVGYGVVTSIIDLEKSAKRARAAGLADL